MFHLPRICCLVALTGMLGACGQKGPLYMPAKPQPIAPAKPAPTPPADNAAPASK